MVKELPHYILVIRNNSNGNIFRVPVHSPFLGYALWAWNPIPDVRYQMFDRYDPEASAKIGFITRVMGIEAITTPAPTSILYIFKVKHK